jgi:CubicO group peptidase (beta-lactamase class C family)
MTVSHFPLDHWPTARWPCAALAEVGIEAAPILALDAEFARGDHGFVDGLTIIRHGAVAFDRAYPHDYATAYGGRDATRHPYNYFHPAWHPYYQGTDLHTLQSVTKSVTAILVGMALARHEIPTLDVPLLQYFDTNAIDHLDDRKQRITLRHRRAMSAGLDWDELSMPYEDPTNVCQRMEQSADWIGFTLNRLMAYEPGTVFAYSSGLSHLLSPILLQATGSPVDAYAATHLFQPLGITDFYWKRAPDGLPDTQSGLYLRRTDLAKIGYLYLRDGWWEGRRLVPRGLGAGLHRPRYAARATPHRLRLSLVVADRRGAAEDRGVGGLWVWRAVSLDRAGGRCHSCRDWLEHCGVSRHRPVCHLASDPADCAIRH